MALRDGPLETMQVAGGRHDLPILLTGLAIWQTVWRDKVPFWPLSQSILSIPVLISALSAHD